MHGHRDRRPARRRRHWAPPPARLGHRYLRGPTRRRPRPPRRAHPDRPRAAAVRFVTSPRTGRLTSLSRLPEQGPGVPFVRWRAAVGDLVHAARTNADRLGCFVVTGQDADEVEERADALGRQIQVQIEPLPAAGGPGQVRSARTQAATALSWCWRTAWASTSRCGWAEAVARCRGPARCSGRGRAAA
ncbi:hypothetical protein [Streptomyces sp. enrichment culture]|uniref:hypothetical protein n=1 Tax=Streptomyces sp. enrichment culture TaxID=1795815 RepID=UPI003F57178D